MQKQTKWRCPSCSVEGIIDVPFEFQYNVIEFCDECGSELEYVTPKEALEEEHDEEIDYYDDLG